MKLLLILLLIGFSFGCKESDKLASNTIESTSLTIENPITFQEKLSNAAI